MNLSSGVKAAARLAKSRGALGRLANAALWMAKRASAVALTDKTYMRLYSRMHLGRAVDLKTPRTFNEKIQWLKLHARLPIHRRIVDKADVREFVAERAGPELLIPLHGLYDSIEQIDPLALPDRFVLKPTHGSGWVVICSSQSAFDWEGARRDLRRWLRRDYYFHAREWAYRGLRPRIIAEQALLDAVGQPPMDYKFFCFDGEPRFVQVDVDRFGGHRRNFYDTTWQPLDMTLLYPKADQEVVAPRGLTRMLEAAKQLSAGFPFIRVDLYQADDRVLFGELTLFPENGVGRFAPPEWDRRLGDMLGLDTSGSKAR